MKIFFTCLVCLVLITGACTSGDTTLPCAQVLRGKLVGKHPLCAGAVIQIVSGSYDANRVEATWRDTIYDPESIYEDVFTALACDIENELPENIDAENETEFYFVFTDFNAAECLTCDPLVALPLIRNQIKIVGKCVNMGEE